jgi:hypothetical protein
MACHRGIACELGQDHGGRLFPKLDTPLVKAEDIPYDALRLGFPDLSKPAFRDIALPLLEQNPHLHLL